MSNSEDQDTFEFAQYAVDSMLKDSTYKGYGHEIHANLSLLSASAKTTNSSKTLPNSTSPVLVTVAFRLRLPQNFANRVGNLHGGATATIFDNLSSVAIAVWAARVAEGDMAERWMMTGVSRTLNTSYLRAVQVGEEVDVVCEVVAVGRRLALVRGHMMRSKDGKMVATCEHHKATPDLPPPAAEVSSKL